MADINQVITLGIGTPSDIPHFLTLGLSIGAAVIVTPIDFCHSETVYLMPDRTTESLTPVRVTGSCCDDCE